MVYTAKDREKPEMVNLKESLNSVLKGLGYSLIELVVSNHRGSVQVRVIINRVEYESPAIGTNDCSKVHRVITPRLELAYPDRDIYLEVSSPGVDRLIKNGEEFHHYTNREVRCYRTDISDWTAGKLLAVDENGIVIKTNEEDVRLNYCIIAKARLA